MDYSKIYIDGEWVEPQSKDSIEVENPATLEIIEKVPACHEEDVNRAVAAAKKALPSWFETPLEERIKRVREMSRILRSNLDDIAEVVAQELGCPVAFAGKTHVESYLNEVDHLTEIVGEYDFTDCYETYRVVKEPVGVVACMTPWNYPFGQITKKIAPALIAGNTILLKPSRQTPMTAYWVADAADKAGFPPGVFNLLPGKGAQVGNVLTKHKDVDMVSFTGSTKGGIEVATLALNDVKRVTLELGGKSAAIVLPGADLSLAVKKVLDTVYLNVGQTCSALTRLLVPETMKKVVEEEILKQTKGYVFGNPQEEGVQVGPLQSRSQFEKVRDYIALGVKEGARLLIGSVPEDTGDYFVGPTVFIDVSNGMQIAQEEIFGPVLSVISYNTEEEAVALANDTVYGLSGAVFGPEDKAVEVASRMKTGNIFVNSESKGLNAPFGGFKHSGIGREGGFYGLEEFMEYKALFF